MSGNGKVMEEAAVLDAASVEPKEGLKGMVMAMDHPRFPADSVPDIWCNIFEKLDLEDKKTFSRACVPWRNLAATNRTTLHLPKGVNVLVNKHPASDLLKVREASRLLTQEMDCQRHNHASNVCLEFQKVGLYKEYMEPVNAINRFCSTEEIQNFLRDMRCHSSNPFPGRSVRLELKWVSGHVPDQREAARLYREFWETAAILFEKFGSYVHKYAQCMHSHDQYRQPNYFSNEDWKKFQNLLQYLPNLRMFTLLTFSDIDISPELMDSIRQSPLPQLLHLETLELGVKTNLEIAIMESGLLPPTCKRVDRWNIQAVPEALFNYHNLEALSTLLELDDLRRFGNLESVPPFKELEIFINNGMETVQDLFNALEPFGPTLTHLVLGMILMSTDPDEELTINLPKLEILDLSGYAGSFDFLVQLTSLSDFKIGSVGVVQRVNNLVEFYGFENRMYESNIWRLMPSLKTLTLHEWKYERHIYENVHAAGNQRGN